MAIPPHRQNNEVLVKVVPGHTLHVIRHPTLGGNADLCGPRYDMVVADNQPIRIYKKARSCGEYLPAAIVGRKPDNRRKRQSRDIGY